MLAGGAISNFMSSPSASHFSILNPLATAEIASGISISQEGVVATKKPGRDSKSNLRDYAAIETAFGGMQQVRFDSIGSRHPRTSIGQIAPSP